MAETTIIPPWKTPRNTRIFAPEYTGIAPDQVSPLAYVEVREIAPEPPRRRNHPLVGLFIRVSLATFGVLFFGFVAALVIAYNVVK